MNYLIKILAVFFALTFTLNAYSKLELLDPQRQWEKSQANISDVVIEITPEFNQTKVDLTMNIGNLGTDFENYNAQQEIVLQFNLFDNMDGIIDSWLWVGDTIVVAELMDKGIATGIYEGIVKRRRDPSLLSKINNTTYELRVYPLLKRDSRKVKISFSLANAFDGKTLSSILNTEFFQRSKNPFDVEIYLMPSTFSNKRINGIDLTDDDLITYKNASVFHKTINSNDLANLSIDYDVIEVQDYYFDSHSVGNENLLEVYFDRNNFLQSDEKFKQTFLIDFSKLHYHGTKQEYINTIKNYLNDNIGENDSINIILSNISIYNANEKYLIASKENLTSILDQINDVNLADYSFLPTLLSEGFDFVNEHGGQLILFSTSASYHDTDHASFLHEQLSSKIFQSLELFIIDLSNKDRVYRRVGSKYYYGNEYLYKLITDNCSGNYSIYENHKNNYNNVSSYLSENVPNALSSFTEVNFELDLDNGVILNEYPLFKNNQGIVASYHGDNSNLELKIYGKYKGEFFFEKVDMTRNIDENSSHHNWVKNVLFEMENGQINQANVDEMIRISREYRVLSKYTAFLALEPWMMEDLSKDDDDNDDVNTSIETIYDESILSSYPNPASISTTIKINSINADELLIMDLNGKIVFELTNPTTEFKWDLSDLEGNKVSKGSYLILLKSNNKIYYFKLIVA